MFILRKCQTTYYFCFLSHSSLVLLKRLSFKKETHFDNVNTFISSLEKAIISDVHRKYSEYPNER